jgi:DNA-directed RNA polymerase I subunit RPA1
MNISVPVTSQVYSVGFNVYNSDEVRKISVKQITNSQSLDITGAPTPNGLYDLALGPFDKGYL